MTERQKNPGKPGFKTLGEKEKLERCLDTSHHEVTNVVGCTE
jgi:hypothetical protein